MIREFMFCGTTRLTFHLDGDNSYCLINGERMENEYHQWAYEVWIAQNGYFLKEVNKLGVRREIKKHTMTN